MNKETIKGLTIIKTIECITYHKVNDTIVYFSQSKKENYESNYS